MQPKTIWASNGLAYNDGFETLIQISKEIRWALPSQEHQEWQRAIEWATAAAIYHDQLDRCCVSEYEAERIHDWLETELGWAVATFNGCAYAGQEIRTIEHEGWTEFLLAPKEY